jgi:SnoaL-like domain
MRLELAPAIERYFDAEGREDLEALAACFTKTARVRDEGRTVEGRTAIKEWIAAAKAKYHHVAKPFAVSHRGERVVVTVRLSGAFPSSPLDIDHAFELSDGQISYLEIG